MAIRYDHSTLHQITSPDSTRSALFYAIFTARVHCENRMHQLCSDASWRTNVRRITFDNEWDRFTQFLIRTRIARPDDLEIFQPFYTTIIDIISVLSITRLRLISLALTSQLVACIAHHTTLRELVLERCLLTVLRAGVSAVNRNAMQFITLLELGFTDDTRTHSAQWMVISLCPHLKQLYAYATNDAVPIRFPTNYTELDCIHRLERLHVQTCSAFILHFVSWIEYAAKHNTSEGALQFIKIHSSFGILLEDVEWLVDVIQLHHRRIRVLVLEGIEAVPSDLISRIGDGMRCLEGLTIIRRAGESQARNKLCTWEEPIYAYASALHTFPRLRHLAVNFLWNPYTYSPHTLDSLLAATTDIHPIASMLDASPSALLAISAEEVGARAHLYDRLERADCMDDGTSTAIAFAAHCPTLDSFAIRADTIVFSCAITRDLVGGISFRDVYSHECTTGFEYWNPSTDTTWHTI